MAARPLVARQPNERLQALIQEAGCSNAGLARRVNLCGAEHGLDLRYDKTSVARWLRGQQPRGQAPAVIAEAIGRKLGRGVSLDEIGMADGKNLSSHVGLQFAAGLGTAVEQACELWRSDVGRRDFLTGAAVAASALVEPSRDWLITPPDEQVARGGGITAQSAGARGRVGRADVAAVQATTEMLVELDHRFGSGHVRPVVVHYLNSVVSGMLTGVYTEETGRRLFAAVSRLTELAGYMAVDTGQPGLAQRYYIQALRLAQAAGDRGYGGYVLAASMSHLAASLGNPREIAQLARAAQEGARNAATPTAMAMFHAAEARGHALQGDARACEAACGRAAAAMEHSRPDEDPPWIAHFDQAYLADELAHCYRDLDRPRESARYAEEALAGHPEGRVRRRAVDLVLLATAQLRQREVEEACDTGARAVELLSGLRSNRGAEYLDDFQRSLEPFQGQRSVRDFQAMAAAEAA
ncbi:hypothetical protein [Phaeacidiphilus oryzae]|uniref:hypothetical protein n=1 Tax=Phaeacidiphilus oryzae TaxID=348818 RepID=UPI0005645CB4|nr:hypothetical protein [Phaeacidiphilus oryzae]